MKTKILELLEKNAKLSIKEIAEELDIKEKEALQLVGELEADKVICGYSAIINWDKITEEKCNALIEVKVTPQRGTGFDRIADRIQRGTGFDRIADRISRFDEVDSIYLISGGYDFMVIINGKSMKEVSSFVFNKLATIDYVQSTATHFVLKKYKDHGVLLEDKKIDKRTNIVL